MELNDRIEELLKHQRLTSSQFADNIGVQRSSMSHIISGRNKPSLDFVQKVLENFKFVNSDWLLFGKGPMTKEMKQQTLFDFSNNKDNTSENQLITAPQVPIPNLSAKTIPPPPEENSKKIPDIIDDDIDRIVIFYKNGLFKSYSNKN